MQKVLMAHPRLRLAADFILLPVLPALRHKMLLVLGRMHAEVFRHEAALGNDNGLAAGRGRDGDDGGLAERVDFLQFGRREHGLLVAVKDFDFVREAELFEQPDDALGARLFEPTCWGIVVLVSLLCMRERVVGRASISFPGYDVPVELDLGEFRSHDVRISFTE